MSAVAVQPLLDRSLRRTLTGLAPVSLVVQLASFGSSIALAVVLGATVETDAYYLALAVPSVTSGVLMAAIRLGAIPALTEIRGAGEAAFARAAGELVTSVFLLALGATVLVTSIMAFVLPAAVDPELAGRTRLALVELAPYAVFGAVAGALGAVLAVQGSFAAPVAALALEPLAKIPLTVFLGDRFGMQALIAGNLVGSALGLGLLLWVLRRRGTRIRLVPRFATPFVRAVLLLSVPLVVSQSVLQLNPLIDRWMASDLGTGSVTALELGLRLFLAPAGLLTGLLIAPLAATWAVRRDAEGWAGLRRSVTRAVEGVALVVPPLVVGAVVLRVEAASFLFSGGAYPPEALADTARVFAMIALSLPAQVIIVAFSTLFIVQGDAIFPMKIAAANVILNVALNLVFRHFFGVAGIALATSVTLTVLLGAYVLVARRRWGRLLEAASKALVLRVVAGAAAAAAAGLLVGEALPQAATRAAHLGEIAAVGVVVATAHFAVLAALREPTAVRIFVRLRSRLGGAS